MRYSLPAARSVPRAEYEALAAFRYALRQFLAFSERAAVEVGLTPRQHQALLAVHGFPGPARASVGDLAERLQVRHHSAVGLVDRLAARGLLQREPRRQDRRQVLLRLTRRGLALLGRLSASHREELRRIGPRLGSLLRTLAGPDPRPLSAGRRPRRPSSRGPGARAS